MNKPAVLPPQGVEFPSDAWSRDRSAAADRARPETRQRRGKLLVVAGWITAMVGVGLYCAASFAADAGAELPEVLRTIPAARAGLAVIGAGTLAWAIGSVMHMSAALDASGDDAGGGSASRRER